MRYARTPSTFENSPLRVLRDPLVLLGVARPFRGRLRFADPAHTGMGRGAGRIHSPQ
jgi:hypothetical protein